MRLVMFYQSLISDWNHGNAHFLRGITTELLARGHAVDVYEPADSWSVENLFREHGQGPEREFHKAYPMLSSTRYDFNTLDLDRVLSEADLVLVHEWNEPELIEKIGRHGAIASRRFKLLFHDTHHRLVNQDQLGFKLDGYDGVLAYGRVITGTYLQRGWIQRAWTWHEAADVRVFHPMPEIERVDDVVWIGNWGDEERTKELREFLIEPVAQLNLRGKVYGVRYPQEAVREISQAGLEYRGWLPNYRVPEAFARARVTLHIPRGPYVQWLPGIPTIRVFEALACGIPLICSPWADSEELFCPGRDFLFAHNGEEMRKHLRDVLEDHSLGEELAINGLATILQRHTCAHRVDELLTIYDELTSKKEQGEQVAVA
ncbi:MAG TPA: glycosyltransferase [Pyrinomonadaceae bacterium]|nr:glycosyltransferase [Pyrinomonadaceae bacterium]